MNRQSLKIDRALLIVTLTAIAASACVPKYGHWFLALAAIASLIYCIRNLLWLRNFNKSPMTQDWTWTLDSWTCHICGKRRPDRFISVRSTDQSSEFNLPPGTVTQNVRYCNDKPQCIEGAKTKKLGEPSGGDRP